MEPQITPFRDALLALDRVGAERIFRSAVAVSAPVSAVEAIVVPALEQIGAAWHAGTVSLSQVYMSGRYCEELVEQVLPRSDPDRKRQPRSAIVVLHDHHDLGKRIVYSVMRASGFEMFDYGRMEVDSLVERVQADRLGVLLISVLLLPSALKVREVCARLRAAGMPTRIVVGGAPFVFDPQLWREVGADAMGRSASDAVTLVHAIMQELA